jgi:hypothetical protein
LLWRRKADLDLALRQLDLIAGDVPAPTVATPEVLSEESKPTKKESKTLKKPVPEKLSQNPQIQSLAAYLKGATAAQVAQIEMIRRVFNSMDADGDGLLSAADVKAYFHSIGRPSSEQIVRKWIRDRDVDQDGVISLEEFVASFSYQLDPSSHHPWLKDSSPATSSVAAAFGAMKLVCSCFELSAAVTAAGDYIQRILDSPSTKEFWRVSLNESEFHKNIGHIFGGVKLMLALGFDLEGNGQVLALKNPGPPWEIVPVEIRKALTRGLDELQFHKNSLAEPTISNIAAGMSLIYLPESPHSFYRHISIW